MKEKIHYVGKNSLCRPKARRQEFRVNYQYQKETLYKRRP